MTAAAPSPASPPAPSQPPPEAAPAPAAHGWLRRLTGYCWRYRRNLVLTLSGSVLAAASGVLVPLIQRAVVDGVILSRQRALWPLLASLAAVALVGFAGEYQRRYRGGKLALDVQHDLRTDSFAALSRLDGTRQDEMNTGQVVSRSITDLTMVQALLGTIPMLLTNTVLFAASLGIMLWLSPLLTLVAFVVVPALWFIALAARRKLFPASWDAQQQASTVAGIVNENVAGVRVVKGFGQEEREQARLEEAGTRLFASRMRMLRMMARYAPALQAVPALGQVGVLLLGGWLAIHHTITLGTFLAFATYLAQLINPVRGLTMLVTVGQETRASVIRVLEVIDSRPVITQKPTARELPPGPAGIEFDTVRFGYVPSQPVLRGLTLRIEPGETVAVAGASGSGKSTLSLLLPRFYDVQGGAVRVGGQDVRDLTLDSLRGAIGLVMEEGFLFSDTIRANIAYGRPTATDAQVIAAAKAAEADEFIAALPQGYDTVIGEQGLTLSGGQRQRLALARALITNPRILVLDDAISAVDPRTEAGIHATLRRLVRGRTVVIIAHRRSTLALADRVAVIHDGALADSGTHAELADRSPLYRTLLSGPGESAEGAQDGSAGPGIGGLAGAGPAGAGLAGAGTAGTGLAGTGLAGAGTAGAWPAGGARPAGGRGNGAEMAALAGEGRGFGGGMNASGMAGEMNGGGMNGGGIGGGMRAGGMGGGMRAGGMGGGMRAGGMGGGGGMNGGPGRGGGVRGPAPAGLGGGAMGLFAGLPPTRDLMAKVRALPPALDKPRVGLAQARAEDGRFTLRRLLRPVLLALVAGLLLDGAATLAELALPALVRTGIDHGVIIGVFRAVLAASAAGLAVVLAGWLITSGQIMVTGRMGERLLYTLRVKTFAHLQRLGLDYYEREMSGRIMTRMTTDVDALSAFFQNGMVSMVSSVFTFAGVLVALLVINVRLGLTVVAVMPVLAVATIVFRARSAAAYRDAREKVSAVNAELQENVAGLRVTQAYRRENANQRRLADRSDAYRSSRLRAQRYIALYFPFVQFLCTIAGGLVLTAAVGQVHDGALSAGALIAYLLYVDMFFAPVQQLSQVFDSYQQASVGLRRIRDLLRTGSSTPPPSQPRDASALRGRIELRDVHFSYRTAAGGQRDTASPATAARVASPGHAPGKAGSAAEVAAEEGAVNGVSLVIEPGETVALVGRTGAGKSTLVKLIARFYDVSSGAILVDGLDIRGYDLSGYRRRLGVVPQEPYLFAGTVRDAIAYSDPGASDADVEAAARAVGAHEMITRLPGGYQHQVAERGRNLSLGQRQLLALARARLAGPAIALLDEATASLDLASEAAVNEATRRFAARCTTLVVAHRLTTAAAADRIVVLDHGRIAESGRHDDLVAAGGPYAQMWAAFTRPTPVA